VHGVFVLHGLRPLPHRTTTPHKRESSLTVRTRWPAGSRAHRSMLCQLVVQRDQKLQSRPA
jgi:hypothetical protein